MKFPQLQPTNLSAVLFSLRTTIASLVAVAIALWMELGAPQWAGMTVWIVAQNSRGMSLSKGRWRVAGTVLGMVGGIGLIALAPQHPWVFFLLLAGWVGLCTGLACLVESFRGYAMVLAGYTGAIIALGAAEQPDHVFYIAMARGSYIFIGVVCEMVAGMVAVPGADRKARQELQEKLASLFAQSAAALACVARQEEGGVAQLSTLLGNLQALNDQLEFIRIDSHGAHEDAERAYVTLGRVAFVLSRGVGLHSRLASSPHLPPPLLEGLERVARELDELSLSLKDIEKIDVSLAQLTTMLSENREALARYLPLDSRDGVQASIAGIGVEIMLEDFLSAVQSHSAGVKGRRVQKEFRIKRSVDMRFACMNGVRSAAAMVIGALIWEVTAWPYGAAYLSLLSVICARFAIMNNMILVSRSFFYGAVWSVLASIIPVFIVMPLSSDYAIFALPYGVLMFLGGLALRWPATAGMAASYVNFFPWVLGLDNQGRMDEIEWVNQSIALLLALWSGVQVFRTVLPFSAKQAWVQLRRQLIEGLHRLDTPEDGRRQAQKRWVDETTQRMEQVIRFAGQIPEHETKDMVRGTLAVMTVGRNLLTLRDLAASQRVPMSSLQEGEQLTRDIIHLTEETISDHPVSEERFWQEQHMLEKAFLETQDVSLRHDIASGMGSLRIIRFEYHASKAFLKETFTFAEGLRHA